jgi:hypothetical protein
MAVHGVCGIVDIERDRLGRRRWLLHHRSTMARVSRIKVRRSGAFSQRDIVGCEARSSPLSDSRPQASLKAGSLRRSSRSSASG